MSNREQNQLRIVITGSSRGLGLEFVKQYAEAGHRVFALARRPDALPLSELATMDGVTAIACDVVDAAACEAAVAQIGQATEGIDLLLNNAGVAGNTGDRFGNLDFDDVRTVLEVNSIAPVRMSELCAPLLRRGRDARIVHVTSRMGSIEDNDSGGWWAYRMSKAALNMACKNMALELRGAGIATMVVHPGWVRTDMGGGGASLSIAESVQGMRDVIDTLDMGRSGMFFDYTGTALPW